MLTTRLSNIAYEMADSYYVINMGLLDEDNSWDLFCKIVFGDDGCAVEIEEIGKKIVKNCNGLPLAIVVVGGLLAKIECKQEDWERIGGNLSSALNSEDDESCLKILYMSYTQLPVYLKPCFLYMGVFKEDSRIRVSNIVRLWVAEGFLKPIRGKSLELVAREYLKELIDRNLILVHQLGSTGSIKFCKMHDLFRDLCLREAEKERFYNVVSRQCSLLQCINSSRRIIVRDILSMKEVVYLNTSSLVRSLIWDSYFKLPSHSFRLLRILRASEKYSNYGSKYMWEDMVKFVNSRYIVSRADCGFKFALINNHWNLQTLIFQNERNVIVPSEFWNMPQLRHIECRGRGIILPDPPSGCNGEQDETVLQNLQKLMTVTDFRCTEEMVKRIPNMKKMKLLYEFPEKNISCYCLGNLERLHKIESLSCHFAACGTYDCMRRLTFPRSLKKLTLQLYHNHPLEDIMGKVGSLPLLEKLQLKRGYFYGYKWETVDGQFRSLKYLQISDCIKFDQWTTDYNHFPCLEHLVLGNLWGLKEIPSDIGEIPTLRSIEVIRCSDSAVISAREIAREQEEVGNEDLRVKVTLQLKGLEVPHKLPTNEGALMSLGSTPNFQVKASRLYQIDEATNW